MTAESEGSTEHRVGEGDDVWISGGEHVEGEQFIEALDAVIRIQESLDDARQALEELETGLDREDTIRLIKGRNMGMALDDIEAFFDATEAVIDADPGDIAPRLIQSKVSGMTIEEAADVFDELVTLAEKYGSLSNEDAHDQ